MLASRSRWSGTRYSNEVRHAHVAWDRFRYCAGRSTTRRLEAFDNVVHPYPANFNGNIPEHVRRYQDWVLGVVVLAWGATAAATWAASRVGNRPAGGVVALLLAWGLIFNLTKLPSL
jgi:hypothetical protein